MDWNVKNAVNRDVERQHLNKILKEIRGAVDELQTSIAAEGGLEDDVRQVVAGLVENNTEHGITVIYNSDGEVLDFIVNDFTVRLSGDITGEADVVGLRDINITTTLDPSLVGVPEAPIDGYPYWRYGGGWEQVTGGLWQLEDLIDSGFTVKAYDSASGEHSWSTRQMEVDAGELTVTNPDGVLGNPSFGLADVVPGPAGVLTAIETDQFGRVVEQHPVVVTGTAGEIVVADGDAALGNPTISLADVVPTAGGTLQKTTFDTKGRRAQEDTADTDDLPEGAANLYFTAARVRDTVLTGLSTATNAVITAADTVLSALGKLQAQISDLITDVSGLIVQTITNGDTAHAPSGDAVFEALALKADDVDVVHTTGTETVDGQKTFLGDVIRDGTAETNRTLRWRTSGSNRWALFANTAAESGSNLGSNLNLYAYDDAGTFLGVVFTVARSTQITSFAQTPTVGGSTIWHAGNDGPGSGLDADLLDGWQAASAATGATIALRDGNADISVRLIRPNFPDQATISGAIAYRTNNSTDNYVRFCSDKPAIRTFLETYSGVYTPTITNVANVAANTVHEAKYTRVGEIVTVTGGCTIDHTAAGTITQIRISLPIASNINSLQHLHGVITSNVDSGYIVGDSVNDIALVTITAATTANTTYGFTFSYRII